MILDPNVFFYHPCNANRWDTGVNHQEYKKLDEKYFKSILSNKGVLVDVKGIYRNHIRGITYWSL